MRYLPLTESDRAAMLGRYPSSAAIRRTRCRVFSGSEPVPFRESDTVVVDTFAASATSRRVTLPLPRSDAMHTQSSH